MSVLRESLTNLVTMRAELGCEYLRHVFHPNVGSVHQMALPGRLRRCHRPDVRSSDVAHVDDGEVEVG